MESASHAYVLHSSTTHLCEVGAVPFLHVTDESFEAQRG